MVEARQERITERAEKIAAEEIPVCGKVGSGGWLPQRNSRMSAPETGKTGGTAGGKLVPRRNTLFLLWTGFLFPLSYETIIGYHLYSRTSSTQTASGCL